MAEYRMYPESAVWEITRKCNMRCIHCGTHCGQVRDDELTTEEALQLCDDLTELGNERLTLSGGEPLLRPDWAQLASRLTGNGVKVGMVSNGYYIDEPVVRQFREVGVLAVGISVDGPGEKHDEIRRRRGAYEGALRAFRYLRDAGIKTEPVTTVGRYNIDDLPELYELFLEQGLDVWRIQLSIITGRMAEIRDMAVGPEEHRRVVDFIIEMKEKGDLPIMVGENIGYFTDEEVILRGGPNRFHGCLAGLRLIGIESDGNIKGCLSMPPEFSEGNIRDRSLREIWEDPELFSYNRRFQAKKVEGFCRECPHLRRCRCGCAVTAHGASGSRFNNPVCLYRNEREEEEHNLYSGDNERAAAPPA